MDLFLQSWGGMCYLLNKVFFSISQSQSQAIEKKLKIAGWTLFILGVPAWVIILIGHHDWIAASIEAGGIPAMLLGLYNTIYDHKKVNRRFNRFVKVCTYLSIIFGLSFSLYQHSGISSISQVFEMNVMLGFLLGSYLLAKGDSKGWLFFMLMNISMASLMFIQEQTILMVQQLLSLCFVFYGYIKSASTLNSKASEAITVE